MRFAWQYCRACSIWYMNDYTRSKQRPSPTLTVAGGNPDPLRLRRKYRPRSTGKYSKIRYSTLRSRITCSKLEGVMHLWGLRHNVMVPQFSKGCDFPDNIRRQTIAKPRKSDSLHGLELPRLPTEAFVYNTRYT